MWRLVTAYTMPATVEAASDEPEDVPPEVEACGWETIESECTAEFRAFVTELRAAAEAEEAESHERQQAMEQVNQQVITLAHELGFPMDQEIPGSISPDIAAASSDLPEGIERLQRFLQRFETAR